MSATVDSSHETTTWIESGGEQLFGIVTDPAPGTVGEVGVVLLTGGGWMPSTHRNRMYVDLARDLASLSCSTIRIDYRGVGESTGETGVFDFMQPHTSDALAAARTLVERGSRRIVLVGTCYGGRTALAAARHVPELSGLVLSGVPVIDYGGASESITSHVRRGWSLQTLKNLPSRYPKYLRILRSKARSLVGGRGGDRHLSAAYHRAVEDALRRGVRVLVLEGTHDKHHPSFVQALDGRLGTLFEDHADLFRHDEIDGELHGELWPEAQAFTRRSVLAFLSDLTDSRSATPAS